jgi:MFS family permease
VEPEAPGADHGAGEDRREDEQAPGWADVWTRRAPVALALALGGALFLRLPFLDLPLTADEGGYAEVARLWEHGQSLYGQLFVDRPQGLLLVYRVLLDLGADSTVALRGAAAGFGVATVLAIAAVAARVGKRINGFTAALLLGTAGASPFVESFTLSGELIASFVAVLALLAFTGSLQEERLRWVALAGLLCGSAVMVKQSGLDAGVAIGLWLVVTRRWRSLGVLAVAAAVPVLVGVLAALPALALALGPLAVLAALGFRRAPLLLRLWLLGALIGVVGGGNFHAHYYIQLGAPLAALGAYGVTRLGRFGPTALAAVVLVALATSASLSLAPRSTQTRLIWPHDPHLRYDDAAAAYIRARVPAGTPIAVTWGDASLYFLANRPPAVRSLWYRNAQAIPGAAERDLAVLRRGVPLVVALEPALRAFPALRQVLSCRYRPIRVVGPLHLYRYAGSCR